jgi:membrane-bound lytic murein transglycosylase MltF
MPSLLDARPEVSAESGLEHSGFRVGQNPDTEADERNAVQPTVAVPVERICQTIEFAAREYDLPVEFFTRLIWQESRFDTHAISRAGAQGIAQFMPATAVRVGLRNPFDPFEAIMKSAQGHLEECSFDA